LAPLRKRCGVARINILETKSETFSGLRLFPTPALTLPGPDEPPVETFALDTALYSRDVSFPAVLASEGAALAAEETPDFLPP
jgi:hypothetical protein